MSYETAIELAQTMDKITKRDKPTDAEVKACVTESSGLALAKQMDSVQGRTASRHLII